MRWRGQKKSENIEDRRGEGGGFGFPFPRGRGRQVRMPRSRGGKGGLGIFGLLIVLGLMVFFGIDPRLLLQGGQPGGSGGGLPRIEMPDFGQQTSNQPGRDVAFPGFPKNQPKSQDKRQEDEMKAFVATVLGTTEDIWGKYFEMSGKRYAPPKLVLFKGSTRSGCGTGRAQMGPFYCPLDKKIYIDLSFYRELKNRFRAPGDFAQAYVIAHEVGHHVQTILGIAEKVQRAKQRMSQKDANRLQVKMELQADCLAGVWANRLEKDVLEPGDIEEGLNAASAIGDDKIQKQTQGYVVPDAFTHGSSKQRVRWFKQGFQNGDFRSCDTFNARRL